MGLSGWFEESSDDSWGICLYISDPNFSCGLTDGETDYNTGVFHEALVDLKTEGKRWRVEVMAIRGEN